MTTTLRDCSETLALLVSRGLLAAERNEGAGPAQRLQPHPQLLPASGVQMLEEMREGMGITTPSLALDLWVADELNTDAALEVGDAQIGA